jgi:hypothetical protein
MVNHMTRQLTIVNPATKFTKRSAARNLPSAARPSDFKTSWNT